MTDKPLYTHSLNVKKPQWLFQDIQDRLAGAETGVIEDSVHGNEIFEEALLNDIESFSMASRQQYLARLYTWVSNSVINLMKELAVGHMHRWNRIVAPDNIH